jgi:hypothetical protein
VREADTLLSAEESDDEKVPGMPTYIIKYSRKFTSLVTLR